MKKLASVLAHEEWHIRNGADESGAYYAQLTTLLRLGVPPDNNVYRSVQRSMQAVVPALGALSLAFGVWYALGAVQAVPYVF